MEYKFVCKICQKQYNPDKAIWRCSCGGLLNIKKEIKGKFDIDKNDLTLWRYKDLLPVEDERCIVTLGEGMTPLIPGNLKKGKVYFKMEYLCPTGSYKDRGAAVLLSKIKEWGIKMIVEDSSGNAGAAIAAYAARANISCEIYLPEHTSEGKIKQIAAYGGVIKKVKGNRDDTSKAILERAKAIYYASHSYNPLFFEGTKTMAYEIWEQSGGKVPDVLIIPTGNGTMLLGAYSGFKDLLEAGIISTLPKLIAVQSVHCQPIYTEFHSLPPLMVDSTIAEGIAVGAPVRLSDIIQAIKETNGFVITVNDDEILEGVKELGLKGIYVEPTSGTVVAGYYKALEEGLIGVNDKVVLPLTGSGLKKF